MWPDSRELEGKVEPHPRPAPRARSAPPGLVTPPKASQGLLRTAGQRSSAPGSSHRQNHRTLLSHLCNEGSRLDGTHWPSHG